MTDTPKPTTGDVLRATMSDGDLTVALVSLRRHRARLAHALDEADQDMAAIEAELARRGVTLDTDQS